MKPHNMDTWDATSVGGKMKRIWRLWAQALGEKTGQSDKEADAVARFRTILILQGVITNILISINILISWLK